MDEVDRQSWYSVNTAVVLLCSTTHEVKEAGPTITGQTFFVAGLWELIVAACMWGIVTHTRIHMEVVVRTTGRIVWRVPYTLVNMRGAITGRE